MGKGGGSSVDWGQEAHVGIGVGCGAMIVDRLLSYKRPFPRGRFVQGVMLDDHVGATKVAPDQAAAYLDCSPKS